jgi:hypothetical protein
MELIGKKDICNCWYLGIFALLAWLAVNMVYVFWGLNWLGMTDSGWYFSIVKDLTKFDPAIQPVYPAMVALMMRIFPNVDAVNIMQFISLCSYVVMVPLMYLILKTLELRLAFVGAVFFALYPFVGLTHNIYPRANALLLVLSLVAILGYIKNRKWLLLLALMLLPLVHKSGLFLGGLLICVGFWEKKLKFYDIFLIGLPFGVYWGAGILMAHQGHFTWLISTSNWDKKFEPVLGLPVLDGFLGTFYLAVHGKLSKIMKAVLTGGAFFVAVFLAFSRICREKPVFLAMCIPTIFLGFVLPEYEILSVVKYTTYLCIPLFVFLDEQSDRFELIKSRFLWAGILVACFISQIAFAIYTCKVCIK